LRLYLEAIENAQPHGREHGFGTAERFNKVEDKGGIRLCGHAK
jgi:hypothetical protein